MDCENVLAFQRIVDRRVELLNHDQGTYFGFGMLAIGEFHPRRHVECDALDPSLAATWSKDFRPKPDADDIADAKLLRFLELDNRAVRNQRFEAVAVKLETVDVRISVGADRRRKGYRSSPHSA